MGVRALRRQLDALLVHREIRLFTGDAHKSALNLDAVLADPYRGFSAPERDARVRHELDAILRREERAALDPHRHRALRLMLAHDDGVVPGDSRRQIALETVLRRAAHLHIVT